MTDSAMIQKFRPRFMPVKFSIGHFLLGDELHIVLNEIWLN